MIEVQGPTGRLLGSFGVVAAGASLMLSWARGAHLYAVIPMYVVGLPVTYALLRRPAAWSGWRRWAMVAGIFVSGALATLLTTVLVAAAIDNEHELLFALTVIYSPPVALAGSLLGAIAYLAFATPVLRAFIFAGPAVAIGVLLVWLAL
jgi:hypothetical protein